jgi:hypothetical protein
MIWANVIFASLHWQLCDKETENWRNAFPVWKEWAVSSVYQCEYSVLILCVKLGHNAVLLTNNHMWCTRCLKQDLPTWLHWNLLWMISASLKSKAYILGWKILAIRIQKLQMKLIKYYLPSIGVTRECSMNYSGYTYSENFCWGAASVAQVAEFLPGKCKTLSSNTIITKKLQEIYSLVLFYVNIYYYLCTKVAILQNLKLQKYIRKEIKSAHNPISRNNDCYHFGVAQLVPSSVFISICYCLIIPYILVYSVVSLILHHYNFPCS